MIVKAYIGVTLLNICVSANFDNHVSPFDNVKRKNSKIIRKTAQKMFTFNYNSVNIK